jgi:hypothetical protein
MSNIMLWWALVQMQTIFRRVIGAENLTTNLQFQIVQKRFLASEVASSFGVGK